MLLVEILGTALPAGGLSEPMPSTGLVSGALIKMRIDKRFGQRHGMAPVLLPVSRKPPQHQLHETTDEIGALASGQNQQARVVGQQRQARASLLVSPADKLVASLEVQRRRVPGRQRQPLASIRRDVTQMFAHQLRILEVMMLGQQLIESLHFIGWDGRHNQMNEYLLFIDGRLAKADLRGWFHSRSIKSCRRVVPQNLSLLFPPKTYSHRKTRPTGSWMQHDSYLERRLGCEYTHKPSAYAFLLWRVSQSAWQPTTWR